MAWSTSNYVLLLFSAIILQVCAYNSYMVVCPKSIRPGMEFTCKASLLGQFKRMKVTVTLESEIGKFHLSKDFTILRIDDEKLLSLDLPLSLPVSKDYELSIMAVDRSGAVVFKNQTALTMQDKSMSVFIQTDKAIYKPGQNVQFRCFAIDPNLQTINGNMDIDLFDPTGNQISQWRNVTGTMGVFQGQLQLSVQPPLGDWSLEVNAMDKVKQTKTFTVAEYVLPKFEVSVSLASFGVMTDTNLAGTIKAKYTFGKGVEGVGKLVIKKKYPGYREEERQYSESFGINGEYNFQLPLKDLFIQLNVKYPTTLEVSAEVTETLTGKTLAGMEEIQYYNGPMKLVFLDGADNYKPGLNYTGYVYLSDQNDQPFGTAATVNITVTLSSTVQKELDKFEIGPDAIAVPKNGIAAFSFYIPINTSSLSILAEHKDLSGSKYLTPFQSPSNTFIQVTMKTQTPKAGRNAKFHLRSTKRGQTVTILIVSRGKIVECTSIKMKRKCFTVKIRMTSQMAPTARIIVYFAKKDAEIIADSLSFNVEGMFENKVNVGYSKRSSKPGRPVSVVVNADPGSQCSVLTVDKSVLLLKSGNDITQQMVEDEISMYDSVTPPSPCQPFAPCLRMWFPVPNPGTDVSAIFLESGLVVMTDAYLYKEEPFYDYLWPRPIMMEDEMLAMPMMRNEAAVPTSASSPRVRQEFPETWWFSNAIADGDGKCYFNGTTPDTITTWVATAFAVNKKTGLGVAQNAANLRTFLNFFIRLELPYSVVRGEQLILQANLFNFFRDDLEVTVTLKQSDNFENIKVRQKEGGLAELVFTSKDIQRKITIPAGGGVTVNFPIRPTSLGNIDVMVIATSPLAGDAVKRQLLVKAEGIPECYNIPFLVDVKEWKSFYHEQNITFPDDVVPGSEKIRISAMGDLMGPIVNGLTDLLRMPYGCGEQNMINFAPNVYVLKYLEAINHLNPADLSKAQGFMLSGYQRELTYKHFDGSFSAFGNSDASGSTWLTAFVVKSFAQARPYIFIDKAIMRQALNWLLSQYNDESGIFAEPGRVIHTEMQGGSGSGERSLAAFTLISLLEATNNGFNADDDSLLASTIHGTRTALENDVENMSNVYELCIVSYALALDDSGEVETVFDKLEGMATQQDGMMYWEVSEEQDDSNDLWKPPYIQANSRNIEATSYVLLAYAVSGDVTSGLKVVKWLVQQRNANGGFGSTQDTVIALQALSEFAALVYSPERDMSINILGDPVGYGQFFKIDATNALLYQSAYMPNAVKTVKISAEGIGMALVEIAVCYNVMEEPIIPMFGLTLEYTNETFNGFDLTACFWWKGDGASSMAVMEIDLLSGFVADTFSITSIGVIKRVDEQETKLVLYFDEITPRQECLTVKMERNSLVVGSQPAPVTLYDYYKKENRVTMLYHPKILKDTDICSIDVEGLDLGC